MAKRPMPKERADFRDVTSGGSSTAPVAESESTRLGKQHMAVAANKARANLAAGQKSASQGKTDPYSVLLRAFGRGK